MTEKNHQGNDVVVWFDWCPWSTNRNAAFSSRTNNSIGKKLVEKQNTVLLACYTDESVKTEPLATANGGRQSGHDRRSCVSIHGGT